MPILWWAFATTEIESAKEIEEDSKIVRSTSTGACVYETLHQWTYVQYEIRINILFWRNPKNMPFRLCGCVYVFTRQFEMKHTEIQLFNRQHNK